MENLVTITIRSTHYYLIDTGQGILMVDTGWPDSMPELKHALKRYGIDLAQIRFIMVTHNHPDHAGLTQELKQASNARLIIHEIQIPFLIDGNATAAGKIIVEPIQIEATDLVVNRSNRAALNAIGIQGEIVETPGHSEDSVSLVLDSGMAFIGDLHPPNLVPTQAQALTCLSWKKLLERNARQIYPAHGVPFSMDAVRASLRDC